MLAAKISQWDKDYLKVVNMLFQAGSNHKLKDQFGWRLVDEAVSQ